MLDQAALAALNHLLRGAAWARERLVPFAGKSARLTSAQFQLDLVVTSDGLLVAADPPSRECDVVIALPPEAPLLALYGRVAVVRSARIGGSAEFADAIGFVLRNLTWDFEEDLSSIVGDIAAHRIAGLLRSLGGWHEQARRNFAENFADYLTEERRMLMNRNKLDAHTSAIAALHSRLALLEAQLLGRGATPLAGDPVLQS